MKRTINIITILFLLFSCEEPTIEYLRVVPPGNTVVSYEGGEVTAEVTAFEQPKVVSNKTWVRTAVTKDGNDSYTVTMTVRQNIWENERAAVITVSAGTMSDSFEIQQHAAPLEEEDDQVKEDADKDEDDESTPKARLLEIIGNRELTIIEGQREAVLEFKTDIPVDSLRISTEAEWMTLSLSEGKISLSVEANDLFEDRTSTVKLEALVEGVRALEWNVLQNPEIVTPDGMVEFEDLAFKKAVVKDYDTDGDRQISIAEAEAIKRLDVSGMGIRSLKGVGPMKGLEYLDIRGNLMADPDTSKVVVVDLSDPHPFLIDVLCDEWSAVDFSGCAALVWVTEDPATQIIELNEKSIADKSQDILGNSDVIKNRTHKPVRSADISKDDEEIILMEHTKGQGIKIRFSIQNLLDTDYESGLVERICQMVKKNIFLYEPISSYVEYFDLVFVIDVDYYRRNEYYPGYGNEASDADKEEFLASLDNHAGKLPIYINEEKLKASTTCFPTSMLFNKNSESTLSHELIGHIFGSLKDEYVPKRGKTAEYRDVGTYPTNTIYTNDPDKIPWYWKQLMDNPSYQDKVGLYEGGEYEFGEWRASHQNSCNSIMANGSSKNAEFNPICRFCLLWTIIEKAKLYNEILPNPPSETRYIRKTFDDIENQEAFMKYFLDYDKRNL